MTSAGKSTRRNDASKRNLQTNEAIADLNHKSASNSSLKRLIEGDVQSESNCLDSQKNKSSSIEAKSNKSKEKEDQSSSNPFVVRFEFNLIAWTLVSIAFALRIWTIDYPRSVVFDELNYGKFISLYMRRVFYFDSQPPLGKQIIAIFAYFSDYNGNSTFNTIGAEYPPEVPIKALRFCSALFGSLIIPIFYQLIVELKCGHKLAFVFSLFLLLENSFLTQSRLILVDSILLFFMMTSLLSLVKLRQKTLFSVGWFSWLFLLGTNLAACFSIKFVGIGCLALSIIVLYRDLWLQIPDKQIASTKLFAQAFSYLTALIVWPLLVYCAIFYVHLSILTNAGPHDNIMTSSFQASLNGGLASIIRGQPLEIAHGSQITIKHTHGRSCWLHSHTHLYPIRYPDGRGSSHQQQVTCYSFKDVNNWWIVKKPEKNDLITSKPLQPIKHGDTIQLVHGLSSRLLNSHNVAAPMSPQNQEVSCYIDYNISMPAQNLWKVHLLNPEETNGVWHTIISHVRLVHESTNQALKFSGKQYGEWGFNQHEVVTDKAHNSDDTIWNVEEHRHTKSSDEKEREKDMVGAEFVPLAPTTFSFWDKMKELQYKMLIYDQENVQEHMFAVDSPFDLLLLKKGIAYWLDSKTNSQIFLLGNIVIWYFSWMTFLCQIALFFFYLLRRRRNVQDLTEEQWSQFLTTTVIIVGGYLIHMLPLFFTEKPLFLHHYLPAFLFQFLAMATFYHHLYKISNSSVRFVVHLSLLIAFSASFYAFIRFLPFSYGYGVQSADHLLQLKWKSTWNFIVRQI